MCVCGFEKNISSPGSMDHIYIFFYCCHPISVIICPFLFPTDAFGVWNPSYIFFFKLCATLFLQTFFFHGIFYFLKYFLFWNIFYFEKSLPFAPTFFKLAPSTFTYWISSSHTQPPPLAFHILIIVTYYLAWSYREIPNGLLKYLLFSLLVFSLDSFIFPISSKKFSP